LVIQLKLRVEKLRKSKADTAADKCDVTKCDQKPKRAVSLKKLRKALPSLKIDKESKRVHLCKEHYKEFKKATKTERTLERLTWD
jgi:hypothetical protein